MADQPPTPQWQPLARLSALPSHKDSLLHTVTEHHKALPPTREIAGQRQAPGLLLLGAAVLLAMLVGAGWSTARAAPQSGGPTLTIVRIQDNTLTLQFDNWALHDLITLSYSADNECVPLLPLPHPTFSAAAPSFQTTYIWPSSGIQPGVYYLCATASEEGTVTCPQTLTENGPESPRLKIGG